VRGALFAALFGIGLLAARAGAAAEQPDDGTRQLTREEIQAWLQGRSLRDTSQDTGADDAAEAPPLPPRHHGLNVEAGVGALGHVGTMRTVTPTSPWFHLQVGYEPLPWLMFFGEGDLIVSNTSNTHPPPEPRAYVVYGFGGGVRFTVAPFERLGFFAQGSLGTARASTDVLEVYGYEDADAFNAYFGGLAGAEWYPVNPHYALVLGGGARVYPGAFERQRNSELPLAWLGVLSIRYTF
jgi:hypothetical protein